ncbi:MAG: hypothetical protein HN427_04265 [Flavobacteriales bacterium]|mgnify:FL=1|jgi:hypothetical protein|nr:hypothetical protein [Flavobacteriales bacterium]MBT6013623.1 hypothetical protein [Flavobacteriales bacterium]MBT7481153.1 hypothetical protein [Flavobacteriales bacterium]
MKNKVLLIISILFIFTNNAFSQCAMCKAVVETNLESGGSIGAGLNDGILYLMAMPYLSVLIIGLFWYRLNKKEKVN